MTTLIVQNTPDEPLYTLGFPICDSGESTPILGPTVALNDPAGPQDLYCDGGDPLWMLEGTSTRHARRITLWQDTDGIVGYTRPLNDSLFPASGAGPGYVGTLWTGVDAKGNFYWVGHNFDAANDAIIRIRKVTLAGVDSSATINIGSMAPSTLPSDASFAYDASDNANGVQNWCVQEDGFLVVGQLRYFQAASPFQSRDVNFILKVDSSLSPTLNLVAETGIGSKVVPMPDGMISEGRISGSLSTLHYASDGTLVNFCTPELGHVGGYPNGGGIGFENWFLSLDEVDGHLYYYQREGGPATSTSHIRRFDLTTLTEDTLGWYAMGTVASFIVSPNGHRIAVHDWDWDVGGTGMYRVYDRSGSLLMEKSNITPKTFFDPWWPCEYHLNVLSQWGWQHTVGNRVAFRTAVIAYFTDRVRIGKMPLDSILAFYLLARAVENNPNSPFVFFIRGQWSHFDYTDWPV